MNTAPVFQDEFPFLLEKLDLIKKMFENVDFSIFVQNRILKVDLEFDFGVGVGQEPTEVPSTLVGFRLAPLL